MCYLTENLKYEFVNKTQVYKHLFEKNFIGCNIFHVQFSVTPNNDSAQPHQHNNTVFKGQVLVFWNFLVFILTISDFFWYLLQKLTLDTQYYLTISPLVITIFEIVQSQGETLKVTCLKTTSGVEKLRWDVLQSQFQTLQWNFWKSNLFTTR